MSLLKTFIIVVSLFAFQLKAQQFLCLDMNKAGRFKRYKYYRNDEIKVKLFDSHKKLDFNITGFADSSLFYEADKEVKLKEIKFIYRDNGKFVSKLLGKFCYAWGPLFVGLDTFNNFINGRNPKFSKTAFIEGACFVGGGFVLSNFRKHRYRVNKKHSIKILDLDM